MSHPEAVTHPMVVADSDQASMAEVVEVTTWDLWDLINDPSKFLHGNVCS
jgi:hypothetical protein